MSHASTACVNKPSLVRSKSKLCVSKPHVAGIGSYLQDRRTELLLDNCARFNEGRELRNIVDKANGF
jgi:hypothetical protein